MIRTLWQGAWLPVLATAFTIMLYWQYFLNLLSKVTSLLSGVFDSSIPAYPQVGLFFLAFFLMLRAKEILNIINRNESYHNYAIKPLGFILIILPALSARFLSPSYSASMEFDALAIVSCWFGLSLLFRPCLFKPLLPYISAFCISVASISFLTPYLGYFFSAIEAGIDSSLTSLLGLPVQWKSEFFVLTSASGAQLSLSITQACSGIASFSIFLLMLMMLHVDMKKDLTFTLWFTFAAIPLLLLINAIRIIIMLWAGYIWGVAVFWEVHGWIGYLLYSVFFLISSYTYANGITWRDRAKESTLGIK
ncbi:MAG: exosortase/archaeosortase family protein [Conexivisphaerales archaeon]